jgi:hypothetical protein
MNTVGFTPHPFSQKRFEPLQAAEGSLIFEIRADPETVSPDV